MGKRGRLIQKDQNWVLTWYTPLNKRGRDKQAYAEFRSNSRLEVIRYAIELGFTHILEEKGGLSGIGKYMREGRSLPKLTD